MRRVGNASCDDFLERVEALAVRADGVHKMHPVQLLLAWVEASVPTLRTLWWGRRLLGDWDMGCAM